MDTTTIYRDIIKQVILKYAQFRPSHGSIRLDPVFDEKQDRYLLMQVGWDRGSMAILFIWLCMMVKFISNMMASLMI